MADISAFNLPTLVHSRYWFDHAGTLLIWCLEKDWPLKNKEKTCCWGLNYCFDFQYRVKFVSGRISQSTWLYFMKLVEFNVIQINLPFLSYVMAKDNPFLFPEFVTNWVKRHLHTANRTNNSPFRDQKASFVTVLIRTLAMHWSMALGSWHCLQPWRCLDLALVLVW